MTDDTFYKKNKAKKALLGELESIKTLLDEPIDDIIDFDGDSDDDFVEPPVLTSAIVDDAQLPNQEPHEDDIPILTEAFDSTANLSSKKNAAVEQESDEQDIPILQEFVDHSGQEEESETLEPDFEDWPDVVDDVVDPEPTIENLADDEPALLDSKDNIASDSNNEEDREEIEGSLFDNLETEFKQQWQNDEEELPEQLPEVLIEEETTDAEEDDGDLNLDSFSEENLSEENLSVEDLSLESSEPSPESKPMKGEDSIATASTESQPSLFDIPDPTLNTETESVDIAKADTNAPAMDKGKQKTEETNASVATENSQQTPSPATPGTAKTSTTAAKPLRPIKTDNPFLPKHIRDRLHTNRSLQDEIMESPLFKTAAAKMQAPQREAINNKAVSSSTSPYASQVVNEQKIIDDLVASYLPKIEQELRKRLQELVKNSSSDKADKSN